MSTPAATFTRLGKSCKKLDLHAVREVYPPSVAAAIEELNPAREVDPTRPLVLELQLMRATAPAFRGFPLTAPAALIWSRAALIWSRVALIEFLAAVVSLEVVGLLFGPPPAGQEIVQHAAY